jgi:hypothetical protein
MVIGEVCAIAGYVAIARRRRIVERVIGMSGGSRTAE